MWSQGPAAQDHGTGMRITVRELIRLHRQQAGSQVGYYDRKRTLPPAPDQNTPPDRLEKTSKRRRPGMNPTHEIPAEEPPSPVAAVAPRSLPPASCIISQPYVQGSPPYKAPDLPHEAPDLPYEAPDLPHEAPYLPYEAPDLPHEAPDLPHEAPDLPREPGNLQRNLSLFQWQVVQESRRLGGVTAEMLAAQDEDGDTYLHVAVAQGKRALAYALASKSGNTIDTKEHNGQSALQIAVITNQHLIVQDLLLLGSKVNTTDHWGRSPLHVCAEKGHVVTLLTIHKTRALGNGQPIDIDLFNYEGLTPLHMAVISYNRLVWELRDLGAACSLVAMELARRKRQYVDCVKTLLLMGARCGSKDLKSGKTVLHVASEESSEELFHVVLKHPSSASIVNEKMYNGNTALHLVCSGACHPGVPEAVAALLRKGADPSARNLENEQPVHLVPSGPIGDQVHKMMKRKKNNKMYLTAPKIEKRCQLDSLTFY